MSVRCGVVRCWFLVALAISSACGSGKPTSSAAGNATPRQPGGWDYSFADIIGKPGGQNESVNVELYLDATVSMAGFVSARNSTLLPLIRDLESAAQTGWKAVSVRYFKFGAAVVEAKRDHFIQGMGTTAFFKEKGVSERTNIDAVLAKSDPSRLTLVVTDLFQHAGDVNAVVNALKDNLIAKDVPVGLLPVLSDFDGTVYDASVPPYPYRSTADPATHRAFYLLMFGSRHDMTRLVDVIGAKPYIDRNKFLMLSPQVTRSQVATLVRPSVSKNLVVRAADDLGPNEFFLDLRDGADASLAIDTNIETLEASAPLKRDRLEMRVVRAGAGDVITTDIMLDGPLVLNGGSSVRIPIKLHLAEPAGIYRYQIDLRTPTLNAFDLPAWVATLNSMNPSPSFEPNKTLNLTPFVQGLVQASTSAHQSPAARIFLRIRKR